MTRLTVRAATRGRVTVTCCSRGPCPWCLAHCYDWTMCNRYVSPEAGDIERYWQLRHPNKSWRLSPVFPRSQGPFIRGASPSTTVEHELVIGQWGLVPWFAKTAKLSYSTNNARFEEITAKASYKHSWQHGKRCIIPAVSFDEPNWESGKNVWWQIRWADGALWGLAGLWNTWTDKATGELAESYTMLTINADQHPLMSRMHKPDPRLGPDEQDKRSVVPIDRSDVDQWLHGTIADAAKLIKLAPVDTFEAGPMAA
jgi:putative SOS response-associated peptidase YedK